MRIIGRRAGALAGADISALPIVSLPEASGEASVSKATPTVSEAASNSVPHKLRHVASPSAIATPCSLSTLPLTQEAFKDYGSVISAPRRGAESASPHVTVNQGTAAKFPDLGEFCNAFPIQAKARTRFHLYRCDSLPPTALPLAVKMLERHRFSSQSFVPLQSGNHSGRYLVVVAKNGIDDTPDLTTLRSFMAESNQCFVYHPGTWHLPMTPIADRDGGDSPESFLDFACVVAESEVSAGLNCDEHWWEEPVVHISV